MADDQLRDAFRAITAYTEACIDLSKRLDAAEAEAAALRDALQRMSVYAEHTSGCYGYWRGIPQPGCACTCGLDELLDLAVAGRVLGREANNEL